MRLLHLGQVSIHLWGHLSTLTRCLHCWPQLLAITGMAATRCNYCIFQPIALYHA